MSRITDREPKQCLNCGESIPLRPGQGRHVYCKKCESEGGRIRQQRRRENQSLSERRAEERWRAFLKRHRALVEIPSLDRRQFLFGLASSISLGLLSSDLWADMSAAQRHEWGVGSLRGVRHALARGDELFAHTGASALYFRFRDEPGLEAQRLKKLAGDLLRDAGDPGNPDKDSAYARITTYARTTYNEWMEEHDYLRGAQALLSLMNIERAYENHQEALCLAKAPADLLDFRSPNSKDPLVVKTLHQCQIWQLRIIAVQGRNPLCRDATRALERMRSLEDQITTPITILESLQEQAGYFMLCAERASDGFQKAGYLDQAEKLIERGKPLLRELLTKAPRVQLPFLSSEIELLCMKKDRHSADEKAQLYRRICEQSPIAHCINRLNTLVNRYQGILDRRLCENLSGRIPSHSNALMYAYLDEEMEDKLITL